MTKSDPTRIQGFRGLREGKIHFRCYTCGRKMSNLPRLGYEPLDAVLLISACPKCDRGRGCPDEFYYDAEGRPLRLDEAA